MSKLTKFLSLTFAVVIISVSVMFVAQKTDIFGSFKDTASKITSAAKNLPSVSSVNQQIQSGISAAQSSAKTLVSQAAEAAKTTVSSAVSKSVSTVQQATVKAASAVQSTDTPPVIPAVPVDTTKPSAPPADTAVSSVISSGFAISSDTVNSGSINNPVANLPGVDYWGDTGMSGIKVYEYGKSFLDSDEIAVYDALKQSVENLDSQVVINTPCPMTDFEKIFQYYYYDHSEIFYMHNGVSYDYRKSNNQYTYTVYFHYDYSKATILLMRTQMGTQALSILNNALKTIPAGKTSDYYKELAIHDAIVNKCTYNLAAVSDPYGNLSSFTAYGAIVEGKCVCDGFARAMKLLLSSVGIRSLYVTGTGVTKSSSGPHAWNMVYVPDSDNNYHWYYLDATFDDPVIYNSNGTVSTKKVVSYNFFNFITDKPGLGTQHILGQYLENDPKDSQNYEVMPQPGV